MRVRSLGFSTDLLVLRAGGSSIEDRGDHLVVRTERNPSYWWGNFVLLSGPEGIQEGIEAFGREFPAAGRLTLGVDGVDGAVPSAIEAAGLEAEVDVVLTATSLRPPDAVEAESRPLSSGADWASLLALQQEDDHPGATIDFQQARVADARRLAESGHGVFLGAFVAGQLVAALGIVTDRSGTARYQHVQTHSGYRRRGLASHLVATAAAMARRRWPLDRLVIVADPDGPAIGLYRSLGFEDAELQTKLSKVTTSGQ